jgi:pimeloyl-ACP methyl ester carboxylesterase
LLTRSATCRFRPSTCPAPGNDPAALGDRYADAAALRSALSEIGEPTVVLGHSYGGAVITEAVTADSGVAHLIYLCAFLLDKGESLAGAVGGTPPPWWAPDGTTDQMSPTHAAVPHDLDVS